MVEQKARVVLPYGEGSVGVEVPAANLIGIASPRDVEPEEGVAALLRRALKDPIGAPPFSEVLQAGDHLLLLVDDITRPTPVQALVPLLLDELDVDRKNVQVTILIALGTHRAMTDAEIERHIGRETVSRFRVLNHEWNNESALLDLGRTPNGTPIRVNRLLGEVDVCIGIGNIVPHNLAGWSGGGKIVQPGICGKDTTYHTHLLAARSPRSNMGVAQNPVRSEIERVAGQAGLTGIVNTILDRRGRVVYIVAGAGQLAHQRGVELARSIWEIPVPRLADIVLVSSYPADLDFWQANKGLYAAEKIVKRGGDIILLTPCPEGLSSQAEHVATMETLAGLPSRELFHESQRRGIKDYAALTVSSIAACCLELGWVTVVSDGLTDEQVQVLGFERAASVEQALEVALQRQGKEASILAIPHGGETLPVLCQA